MTHTDGVVGTPLFMAPEIFKETGFKLDVDVWALGCLVYALFVGKPPFNAESVPIL